MHCLWDRVNACSPCLLAPQAERQQLASRHAQGQEMSVRQPGVLQLLQSGGQVMVVGRSGVRPLRLQGDGDITHASTAGQ